MPLKVEWDNKKAAANLAKHGVTFEEASTVLGDPLAVIFDDEKHSQDELREIIIGHSCRHGYCWSPSRNARGYGTYYQREEGNPKRTKRL